MKGDFEMAGIMEIGKGLVSGIKTLLTGAVGDRIAGILDRVAPEKLSEAEKARIKMEVDAVEHEQRIEIIEKIQDEVAAFYQLIKDLEGTAKDLMQFGFLGKVVIFLRGIQRPLFGFGTFVWDWIYFSTPGDYDPDKTKILLVINLLVLGFLFGERAIKNLTPVIMMIFTGKKSQ